MLARCAIAFALLIIFYSPLYAKKHLLVFAAASMKNVLESVGQKFEDQCDCKVIFSFAGSGTLARHVEAGAPADIYISADLIWIDWLKKHDAIIEESIVTIAGNRLIVAVSKDANYDNSSLEKILASGRIAIANPASVPAGRYAKQALDAVGLWKKFDHQLVLGENVRVSLALAARADVASAIVYQSDLNIEPRVKMAYLFKPEMHAPIVYRAAQVRADALGAKFLQFLHSSSVGMIFSRFGFMAASDDR